MSYDEAKEVVRNFFKGINQPVRLVNKALEIITEKDYYEIQMSII